MEIHTGGVSAYRQMAFKPPSDREIRHIRDRLESRLDLYRDTDRDYRRRSVEIFERTTSHSAIAQARELWRDAQSIYSADKISFLSVIEALQSARPSMQRWIMADPDTLRAYRKQRIDGYSDSWKDLEPDEEPEDRLDYRMLHDGLVKVHPDDPDYLCMDVHYGLPEDESLTISDKHDILDTQQAMRIFMARCDRDPTDVFGGKM